MQDRVYVLVRHNRFILMTHIIVVRVSLYNLQTEYLHIFIVDKLLT